MTKSNGVRGRGLEPQKRHDCQAHEQIVDGVGQNTRRKTSRLFIDPRPEDPAPTDADQSHKAIAMGESENRGTDECGGKEPELPA